MKSIAIIVLNWNGRDDTLACLSSLARIEYPTYQVIVVDNGSQDDSVRAIQETYSNVRLIQTGENLGYVGGNNFGLKFALAQGFDYALLLNNDTEVSPDFLSNLVDAADSNQMVAIVGPTIYYHAQPDIIWSAGGTVDWKRGDTRMIGINQPDQGQFGTRPRPVDFVTGCAMLIRLKLIKQMGGLDQRLYVYNEDAELCVRYTRAGYRIFHNPLSKVYHKISPQKREASPQVH
jgi:hypothetical protein